jgi:4-aminobutyrate aminotransferase-like enzyme/Ser/Thr protein kinase RdoA (MazF antagonist)
MAAPVTDNRDVLQCPAPDLSDAAVRELAAAVWGLPDVAVRRVGSERDVTVVLDGVGVLKVFNPAEDEGAVDMEVAAMRHLAEVDAGLPVPRVLPTTDGELVTTVADATGRKCLARMTELAAGRMLEGTVIDEATVEQVGALAARTALGLHGFFHPAAGRSIGWDVRRLPAIAASVDLPDPLRLLVDRVRPALDATRSLPSWIQHGDVTLTNVLATGGAITGLIDFADIHHTAAVCDLAVTLTSVVRNTAPHQEAGTWELVDAVLRGYRRHRLLLPAEVDVLGELVLARMLTTAVISAARADTHSDNRAYITQYDAANQRMLDELGAWTAEDLRRRMATLAGTARAPRVGTARSGSTGDLLDRRRRVIGGSLSPLFYSDPVEMVAGEGPWLIARDGTRYLDAYNNVAVVGHAHPSITQAVGRQLAVLNTHSRYPHEGVVELAERITATMPPGLDTCLFTTSGTEANELAWRLATEYTGGTGAVIAEHAYHGTSKWFADLSSNEWPPGYRPAHVTTFAAPRGIAPGEGAAVAEQRVRSAAQELRAQQERPALVLVDPQFTSEGIRAPDGFFAGLRAGAHAEGALFLADEVQSGYGRSGPQLWRFALDGVEPDIVTLGKPMGAGYPIGAVVTRREIADVLARRYEYFSTFAATPVAAAAGLAVLDALEQGDLPANAVRVGGYLHERLRALAGWHPVIGDVCGVGLIAGVDFVLPEQADSRRFARAFADGLKEERILVGLTGPGGDVLKVRPPLVWRTAHVDRFVEALDRVLATVLR